MYFEFILMVDLVHVEQIQPKTTRWMKRTGPGSGCSQRRDVVFDPIEERGAMITNFNKKLKQIQNSITDTHIHPEMVCLWMYYHPRKDRIVLLNPIAKAIIE